MEERIRIRLNTYLWANPAIKNIAVNYTKSVLDCPLFKANPEEYMRQWYALRSKSDGKTRFPEDLIHEIIKKEL